MIEGGEEYYQGKVDFESFISIHLSRIGFLSSKLFETTSGTNWQKNALNYYFAIKSLQASIAPYLDDDFDKKVYNICEKTTKRYNKRHEKKKEKSIKKGRYYDVKDTIEVANSILTLITTNLKDRGLLLSEEVHPHAI